MMSIKYEHLLCVSDALGALHVPLFAFTFFLFLVPAFPLISSAALSRVLFENYLNNPTDKQPLGRGISVQKIFTILCESTAQTQLCGTELMFSMNSTEMTSVLGMAITNVSLGWILISLTDVL